jgi:hypothetical protein
MTLVRPPRHWALLLLIYLAADVMDPSIRGVFFFDSGVLFVDGVVQVKSKTSAHHATTEPMPFESLAHGGRDAGAKLQVVSRPSRPQYLPWKNLKRDDSSSFASSSPPDASPTPPSS